jgi:DNA-binding SARP family transcriptional activator/WD40 repeat protein
VRYGVLGPLLVDGAAAARVVQGRKERGVLAVLLAVGPQRISADELSEVLWRGAPPVSGPRTASAYVARLRAVLGRDSIDGDRSGWCLAADAASDLGEFEGLAAAVAQAWHAGRPIEVVGLADRALACWRGAAFDGFADLDPCVRAAARLDRLRAECREHLLDARLTLEPPSVVIPLLEAAVDDEPLREHRWAALMVGLYRGGRQAEALGRYREARRTLREEVGVDPGPELERTHTDVLVQAPSLLVHAARSPARPAADGHLCPFPALRSYEAEDADVFFGFERLVERMRRRLAATGAVVLVGPSGSGKSSAVRAGLLPVLRAGALPGSERWTCVVTTPATLCHVGDRAPDLVVVDQLEEAFAADDATALDALTAQVRGWQEQGSRLVLVLRSDYWAACAADPWLAELVSASSELVPQLTPDDVRTVIRESARRRGVAVDQDLVEAVIDDIAGREGVLPLLSVAMSRTWGRREGDRLTLAAYRQAGGMSEALAQLAEEVYGELQPPERDAARRMLLRLVSGSGTAWVRRYAAVDELVGDDPAAAGALDRLTAARLLVRDSGRVAVTHEALFAGWPRLHGWLVEDESRRQVRGHLTPAAAAWVEGGRETGDLYRGARLAGATEAFSGRWHELTPDERAFLDASETEADHARTAAVRSARRLRVALAGALALLLVSTTAGVLAVRGDRAAGRARDVADSNRLGAEAMLEPRADRSLLLARQAVAIDDSAGSRSRLFATLHQDPRLLRVRDLGSRFFGVAVSPDGSTLATSTNKGEITLLDAATLTPRRVLRRASGLPVSGLQFVRSGSALLGVEQVDPIGADVVLRRVSDAAVLLRLHAGDGWRAWMTPDGSVVATSVAAAHVWAPRSGRYEDHSFGAGACLTNPSRDGTSVGVVSPAGTASLVSVSTGHVLRRLPSLHCLGIAALSPSGRLAAFETAGSISLVDVRTGTVQSSIPAGTDVIQLDFVDEHRMLVSGDQATTLWDVDRRLPLQTYRTYGANAATVSGDGRTLWTVRRDGLVEEWDTTGRRGFGWDGDLGDEVTALQGLPGSLLVGTAPGRLLVVDPATGVVRRGLDLGGRPTAISPARPGRPVVVLTNERGWRYDPGSGRLAPDSTALAAGPGAVVDVSPTQDLAAEVDPAAASVRLVRLGSTGAGAREIPVGGSASDVAFEPDGRTLLVGVAAGRGADVVVVSLPAGRVTGRVHVSDEQFLVRLAVLGAGRVAVVARDGKLQLWRTSPWRRDGGPIETMTAAPDQVVASADGSLVAISGDDGSAAVVDVSGRRRIGDQSLQWKAAESAGAATVTIDPRGSYLEVAVGSVVQSWPLRLSSLEVHACQVAGRRLSRAEWEEHLTGRAYDPSC